MSNILNLRMLGRFGNQCFQYLHGRAIAERDGLELRTPRWVGEDIFQIEKTAEVDSSQPSIGGYFQNQQSAVYTRTQIRKWFKFQEWVDRDMHNCLNKFSEVKILCHRRAGDYVGDYPTISRESFNNAVEKSGFGTTHVEGWARSDIVFIEEETPNKVDQFHGNLSFVPDFYLLSKCPVLFRGNSTFSWIAGAINTGLVFSPIVKHLVGGIDHDNVEFVEGLWPTISDRGDCSDIYLKE